MKQRVVVTPNRAKLFNTNKLKSEHKFGQNLNFHLSNWRSVKKRSCVVPNKNPTWRFVVPNMSVSANKTNKFAKTNINFLARKTIFY